MNSGEQPSELAVNAVVTPVAGSGNTQFEVTFSGPGVLNLGGSAGGNVIDDGLYQLVINAGMVHANSQTMASTSTTTFWKLFGSLPSGGNVVSGTPGDGNSEVFVNSRDEGAFSAAFNSESDLGAPYNPFMDSKLNGFVNAVDFGAFRQSFNSDWSF